MSEVTIYAKPGCPYCAAAMDDMQRRNVSYIKHNVQQDQAALKKMLELNGGRRQVPTIVQGNQVTVGFNGY
jgi:glutaredoxin